MKKFVSIMLSLLLLFSLTACKKEDVKETTKTETKQEVKKAETPENKPVEEEKEDKKDDKKESAEIEAEVVEITEASADFFSSIPEKFTFVAENKDETVIKFKKDGKFTGYFKGSNAEYDFSGTFSQTFPLDEFTHVSILEEYEVKNVKKGDSSIGGLSNMKEVVFYLPKAPTSAISEEFLKWLPGNENFGENLPDDLYGIFDMVNRTGYYAQK